MLQKKFILYTMFLLILVLNSIFVLSDFNVTLLPPNATIHNPINNYKYNNNTQLINISVSDDYHLITNVTFHINNINYTELNNTNFTFIEGNNNLKLYVTNQENKTTIKEINFIVDTLPPNLIITNPKNNFKYQNTLIDITISATDTNSVDKIWYIINDTTYNYTIPIEYDFGINNNTIYVYANDTLNNTIEQIINFETGYIPPSIDKVIIGQCPTEKQAIINLWIIIIICFILGLIGIIIYQIILPLITGFSLIILSLSFYNCGDILSFVIFIIGLIYVVIGVTTKK